MLTKRSDAIKAYEKALEKDATLWCAFERLCVLKPHELEVSKLFTDEHESFQRLNSSIARDCGEQTISNHFFVPK
jgi:hypothetical protein